MNLANFVKSFHYAFRGLKYVFLNEQNFRFQIFAVLTVSLVSFLLKIKRSEWIVILLLMFFVLILELLNSALEKFIDLLKPRLSFQIEVVKDIMAAIVLCASFFAIIIGFIIFWPYLLELF